jgi:hypothetical protein
MVFFPVGPYPVLQTMPKMPMDFEFTFLKLFFCWPDHKEEAHFLGLNIIVANIFRP